MSQLRASSAPDVDAETEEQDTPPSLPVRIRPDPNWGIVQVADGATFAMAIQPQLSAEAKAATMNIVMAAASNYAMAVVGLPDVLDKKLLEAERGILKPRGVNKYQIMGISSTMKPELAAKIVGYNALCLGRERQQQIIKRFEEYRKDLIAGVINQWVDDLSVFGAPPPETIWPKYQVAEGALTSYLPNGCTWKSEEGMRLALKVRQVTGLGSGPDRAFECLRWDVDDAILRLKGAQMLAAKRPQGQFTKGEWNVIEATYATVIQTESANLQISPDIIAKAVASEQNVIRQMKQWDGITIPAEQGASLSVRPESVGSPTGVQLRLAFDEKEHHLHGNNARVPDKQLVAIAMR